MRVQHFVLDLGWCNVEASKLTPEFVKAYYSALGFHLDDDDLAAVLPGVQAVYDGAQYLAEMLTAEDEPATVFLSELTQSRQASNQQ